MFFLLVFSSLIRNIDLRSKILPLKNTKEMCISFGILFAYSYH